MANFLDMECPECGRDDRIDIAATIWVRVTDNGTAADESDDGGNHDYDSESPTQCCACGHTGHVADFEQEEA